jgi:hypothetical protein
LKPSETGAAYNRVAKRWQDDNRDSPYGLKYLELAAKFIENSGAALDVGCGSSGRFLRFLKASGFEVDGMDIAPQMVELSSQIEPTARYFVADICSWELPRKYQLISAWDSTFHLPLDQHEPVLRKLCAGLAKNGVLLFTAGGGDLSGEVSGSFYEEFFEYSTIGARTLIKILDSCGCSCLHLEYDQYPQNHLVLVARSQT